MPVLVHLTAEKNVSSILRSGIRGERGIYCMPVLPNYYISHQWLRELKRGDQRTIVGVYFRVKCDELTWVGRYNEPHSETTVGQAIKHIMSTEDGQGYELIIPRSIGPGEIQKVRHLPQVLGWRYMSKAHGTPPCPCPMCLPRGAMKSRKIRDKADR